MQQFAFNLISIDLWPPLISIQGYLGSSWTPSPNQKEKRKEQNPLKYRCLLQKHEIKENGNAAIWLAKLSHSRVEAP